MERPRHPRPDLALIRAYRRLGADPPYSDPRGWHGIGLEGYYWRFAGPGWSIAAICGICRVWRGSWAMVTLAAEPGGFERTRIFGRAWADGRRLGVEARKLLPDAEFRGAVPQGLHATPDELRVDLGEGARLHATFSDRRDWPQPAWGALGPAHLVPGLGQYWTPHLLGARVRGEGLGRSLDGCLVYAEKNWGAQFARHWWWGQAPLDDDAGVAFAGGRLAVGAPTAVVVWAPHGLVRLAPPFARTVAWARDGTWRIRARSPYSWVELEGEATGPGLRLPNPIPATRELETRSTHHLLGRVKVTVWRGRGIWLRGETRMAALEDGRGP